MSIRLPYIDRDQMVEVDRLMMEEFHISLLQMMEHAGVNLARLVRWYIRDIEDPIITVLCGNGHNGGGGLVCARNLINWGYRVQTITVGEKSHRKEVPAQHLATLETMGARISNSNEIELSELFGLSDLVVDAIIGYGLKGKPSPAVQKIIDLLEVDDLLVIALDAPTGLDVSVGVPGHNRVQADATLTLALPKRGLIEFENRSAVGKLYLGDISVPGQLYSAMGFEIDQPFKESSILYNTGGDEYESFILPG